MMTLSELITRANEVFSSIILFCPDFPDAAQTNTAKKFGQLTNLIETVIQKINNEDATKFLRISLQEIQKSRRLYEEGRTDKGRDLIQKAEEHFKSAVTKRSSVPRFVAGASRAAQDADSGFPA